MLIAECLIQRDAEQNFYCDGLVVLLCGTEYPFRERLSDGRAHVRIGTLLHGKVGQFAVAAKNCSNDYLLLRISLRKIRRNLRPFAHDRRWRDQLTTRIGLGIFESILQGPGWVGFLRRALHGNVNGVDALVLEDSVVREAAATARSCDDGHLIRSLLRDGEGVTIAAFVPFPTLNRNDGE